MTTPLLRVEDLKTQFYTVEGTVRAVDGISFEVREGEIVGVVGESGAGKSVAARSVLRLIEDPGEIVNGRIEFDGQTLLDVRETPTGPQRSPEMLSDQALRKQIRGREIAMIFQDPSESLNPVFSIGGQIREFIELNRDVSKSEAKDIAIETLREVGIPKPEERYDDYPHQFSGGMQQRVLIAMAFACEPSLVIADEPTTALDVTVEANIVDLVDDLVDRYGTSFLWVTHDMGVIAELADRVNVMYLGEIVEQASVDDIFHDTKHPYTRALLGSIPRPDRDVGELQPIAGVMPEAIDPPAGCRFHPRCPAARTVCREYEPASTKVSQETNHTTACLKYEDVGYDGSAPLHTDTTSGFNDSVMEEGR
ncbi:MAG: ABC transporter ATP-binding protein [Halodesulfurarchaeum sp.]